MTEKQVLEETVAKYNDSVNDISKFKFSSKEVELFCGMLTRFADMKISELKNLNIADVSKSFTYRDITDVAEDLANDYCNDVTDPVWRDIRQDGIKAIQAFISNHL